MNNKDDIVERLERYYRDWRKEVIVTCGPIKAAISRIQSDAKRIAELEAEVERLVYHFDENMNNVDCAEWYDCVQDAKRLIGKPNP